jgi:hypothetical protein
VLDAIGLSLAGRRLTRPWTHYRFAGVLAQSNHGVDEPVRRRRVVSQFESALGQVSDARGRESEADEPLDCKGGAGIDDDVVGIRLTPPTPDAGDVPVWAAA